MKRLLLTLGSVALVGMLVGYAATQIHAGESSDREYWYSSDPGTALLTVRFAGSRSATVHQHTIYADGRYEYQLTDHNGSQVREQRNAQLKTADLTTLLDTAVSAGLMEFDRDVIERRMRKRRPAYIASDAGTMFLKISLERYRGLGQQEATAATHSMSLRDVYFQAQIFPDIEEIQALEQIGRAVERYQRQAGPDDPHQH